MDTPSQQRTRKGIYLRGRPSSKKNSAKTNSPADLGSPAVASVAPDEERAKELASKTLFATAAVGAASPAPTPVNQKAVTGLDVGTLTLLLEKMIQPVIDKLDVMELKVSRVENKLKVTEESREPLLVSNPMRSSAQAHPSPEFTYGPGSRTLEELGDAGGLVKDLKNNSYWSGKNGELDEDEDLDQGAESDESRELDGRAAARERISQDQIAAARRLQKGNLHMQGSSWKGKERDSASEKVDMDTHATTTERSDTDRGEPGIFPEVAMPSVQDSLSAANRRFCEVQPIAANGFWVLGDQDHPLRGPEMLKKRMEVAKRYFGLAGENQAVLYTTNFTLLQAQSESGLIVPTFSGAMYQYMVPSLDQQLKAKTRQASYQMHQSPHVVMKIVNPDDNPLLQNEQLVAQQLCFPASDELMTEYFDQLTKTVNTPSFLSGHGESAMLPRKHSDKVRLYTDFQKQMRELIGLFRSQAPDGRLVMHPRKVAVQAALAGFVITRVNRAVFGRDYRFLTSGLVSEFEAKCGPTLRQDCPRRDRVRLFNHSLHLLGVCCSRCRHLGTWAEVCSSSTCSGPSATIKDSVKRVAAVKELTVWLSSNPGKSEADFVKHKREALANWVMPPAAAASTAAFEEFVDSQFEVPDVSAAALDSPHLRNTLGSV